MNESSTWLKLKEATGVANTIEAAESGYIALDDKSIQLLREGLLEMIDGIRAEVKRELRA